MSSCFSNRAETSGFYRVSVAPVPDVSVKKSVKILFVRARRITGILVSRTGESSPVYSVERRICELENV